MHADVGPTPSRHMSLTVARLAIALMGTMLWSASLSATEALPNIVIVVIDTKPPL